MLPESLTTLANLKDALSLTDTTKDGLLSSIIERVTWWVEGQTHRKVVARNYNGKGAVFDTTKVKSEDYLYLNGSDAVNCGRELHLPAYPIQRTDTNAVTFQLAILQNRSASGEVWDTSSLVEWNDWVLDADNGVIRLVSGHFLPDFRNYRVQCTAGFLYSANEPFVPPDLEALCLELCKQMFRNSRSITSERIGSWSRTYNPQLKDPLLEDVLARYSRIVL